ncbi:putative two-component response regulator [Gordonia polyisoprenivorans NBRC 16320 = JCM 10675]|uniref:Response regulator transcription factor n=1 Tax=Gordonia polyisoprenivorans TaxID=84595 RepID=A0A846WQ88_9ACTN|nr:MULTISPECIES: response regulator transcription factor [Gordonia]NKY02461.1 response regulator transcription factor [Gordonia polyisoprenivorans]OPX15263.1 DNA-binding response regulator [Gordonia sp. i37]QUD85024.1 response regulator transcription factor [Gordonia polyisoprenivorans]GAB26032.1 putative two-component response regulator [Gordonia polyisoprenivorans NBRC 16320 = JCM 10675]
MTAPTDPDSSAEPPICVLITDDHAIVRAGLRALLTESDGIRVVGEAATGEEAIARCTPPAPVPDVVLMDLRLGPGLSGVETTRRLLTLRPVPRVLVVTNHDTDADILAAIEAGASGYLLKDTPPTELIAAVHAAAAGESALSPMVATRLMSRMRAPADAVLTAREIDVLVEVAAGHSNREIAKRLLLSEMTVKSHLVHIFSKLGVRSRTAAVDRARRDGLIG